MTTSSTSQRRWRARAIDPTVGGLTAAASIQCSAMGKRTLSVEVDEKVVELFGSPEAAAAKAREMLVVELMREALISQGRAAMMLGITRWDVLDLMAKYDIKSGPETV